MNCIGQTMTCLLDLFWFVVYRHELLHWRVDDSVGDGWINDDQRVGCDNGRWSRPHDVISDVISDADHSVASVELSLTSAEPQRIHLPAAFLYIINLRRVAQKVRTLSVAYCSFWTTYFCLTVSQDCPRSCTRFQTGCRECNRHEMLARISWGLYDNPARRPDCMRFSPPVQCWQIFVQISDDGCYIFCHKFQCV